MHHTMFLATIASLLKRALTDNPDDELYDTTVDVLGMCRVLTDNHASVEAHVKNAFGVLHKVRDVHKMLTIARPKFSPESGYSPSNQFTHFKDVDDLRALRVQLSTACSKISELDDLSDAARNCTKSSAASTLAKNDLLRQTTLPLMKP